MTISGLILAGGRGTRMGHVDKGLQLFRGAPMVAEIIQRLSPQVDHLMINANQNLAVYQTLCQSVLPDELTGFAGPLAGLQTGLKHCTTEYLVTAPCDSPFLPHDLVARLLVALLAGQAELAVAVTGVAPQLQPQPVFSLMHTSVLPKLTAYLESGGRKMDGWYGALSVVNVHFDDEAAFRNINTLDELHDYEAR